MKIQYLLLFTLLGLNSCKKTMPLENENPSNKIFIGMNKVTAELLLNDDFINQGPLQTLHPIDGYTYTHKSKKFELEVFSKNELIIEIVYSKESNANKAKSLRRGKSLSSITYEDSGLHKYKATSANRTGSK